MSEVALPRRKIPPSLRLGFPLAAAVMTALATTAFYAAMVGDMRLVPFARFLAFPAVLLSSYRRHDRWLGLASTLFFATAFIWQAHWAAAGGDPYADLPGAFTASFLLLGLSLAMHSMAAGRGARETLADDARARGELLQRATSLERVASFVCEEARAELEAEDAGLLLRDPIGDRWELHAKQGVVTSPPASGTGSLGLATWLAERNEELVVADLWNDERFEQSGAFRSLLAMPLRSPDRRLLAFAVLTHSRPGVFGPDQFTTLIKLARAAETALGHASAYERAGWATEHLASQLAAIQQAARELNASLEPETIAGRTLGAAIVVSGATAGAVQIGLEGLEPVARSTTGPLSVDTSAYLERISRSPLAELADAPARGLLLGVSGSHMAVPIRRETRGFGALLLESDRERAFDRQDLQAVMSLASHAAVALENARLFREAKQEREKSQQIVQNMADGLLTLDSQRRVQSLNPVAERLLSRPAGGALGRVLCELLDCGQAGCGTACRILDTFLQGAAASECIWRVREGVGASPLLRLSAAPLLFPEPGTVILIHDVTRDQELAEFQREVISTFSHELRSPLANISALTEVVLEEATTAPVLLSRELLEMLGLQARRLANLSHRTLDVARLDAGAWQLESRPLPVTALARDAVARWQGATPDRSFALAIPSGSLWAWGDEDAVGLMLDNLIENAVKYAPPRSPLTIAVAQPSPGFVSIAVEDCGEPVSPSERALLFERFYRRERTEGRKTYGYGLGLYIVRKLSQSMGGDAWVETLNGTGNRFVFSLPVMREDGEDPDR